jgi:hypothetical protein
MTPAGVVQAKSIKSVIILIKYTHKSLIIYKMNKLILLNGPLASGKQH